MRLNPKSFEIALAKAAMNRRDLASETGISESTLCKAVNEGSDMRTKNIGLICKALNVSVEEIILREEA